jgi:hypothetical protein
MPVEVNCAACGGKFRVPDAAAGKRIKCPKCKAPIDVPSVESWTLKIEDGSEFGPVPRAELDSWYGEGRITAECQLLQTGAPQWQWATDLYPELNAAESAQTMAFQIDPEAKSHGSSSINKSSKGKSSAKGKKKSGGKGVQGSPAVTYLAYASYAFCGLEVLAGIVFIVAAGAIATALFGGKSGAIIAFGFGILIVSMAIPTLVAGYGLMNRKQWGRILTFIVAVINLANLPPLGLAYAVFAFVVLLDKKNAEEFT